MFKIILPSIKFKVERWKYNEEYQIYVSSLGRFKDEHKKDIKMLIGSNGYCMVNTWKGLKAAHRLVLMTYKPLESIRKFKNRGYNIKIMKGEIIYDKPSYKAT